MRIRVLRVPAMTLVALVGTVGLVLTAGMSTLVQLAATALIMGGTGMKALGDPHQWGTGTYVDQVNNTYLSDRNLDDDDLHWVSTPEHFWPATGMTDISFDTSVARGVLSLNNAILATPGEKVVVGYSQSANIATREKRNLADLRAQGATVPSAEELSFVLVANPNRPNGGILARFGGLYIPILGVSFDGATPDDEYETIDIAREYDLIADFPKYPLNLLADLNALFGYFYLHPNYGSSVINLNDPSTYQSHTSGNTTYYLVHSEHLPLLQPLRDIGIPAPLLDLVEPTLRVLIDLAYDRTPENMGVPTRAGLMPRIDLHELASDLNAAARQGVRDALAGLGIGTGTGTDTTIDRKAESVAPVDKPAIKDVTSDASVQEAIVTDAVTRDTGSGTQSPEVKTDAATETKAETTPQRQERPNQYPKSRAERIRDLRRSLLSKKPSDDVAGSTADTSRGQSHPTRTIGGTEESGSARPKTGANETKLSKTQGKPRRAHRAGHSDAA